MALRQSCSIECSIFFHTYWTSRNNMPIQISELNDLWLGKSNPLRLPIFKKPPTSIVMFFSFPGYQRGAETIKKAGPIVDPPSLNYSLRKIIASLGLPRKFRFKIGLIILRYREIEGRNLCDSGEGSDNSHADPL